MPLPNADDAAAELERAAGLGAVAIMVSANIEQKNIGELLLDPLWILRRAVTIAGDDPSHGVGAVSGAARFGLAQSVQYTFDTTLGVGSLIFSGVLDRFPKLTLVLSHGGGAYPYLAGRFDIMHARMDKAAQGDVAQKAPSAYAPLMVYDTIVHGPKQLKFLAELVGHDRLLLRHRLLIPSCRYEPDRKPASRRVQRGGNRDDRGQIHGDFPAARIEIAGPAIR